MKLMHITAIREVGTHGILKTAITNESNLKDDKEIQDLINRETSYMMKVDHVNLLELFRLTQAFGPDLRILSTNDVEITDEDLKFKYPGTATTDDGTSFNISGAVQYTTDLLIGLVKQMYTDNNIIKDHVADMFVPMMLRTYSIEIPLRFDDLIVSMSSDDVSIVFSDKYPESLSELKPGCAAFNDMIIKLPFLTDMVAYPERYDKLINGIYYSQLKHSFADGIGKVGLSSVSRLNPTTRNMETFSLYNSTGADVKEQLSKLAKLNTPLEFKFMIKLPIYYMQLLEHTYRADLLNGSYRSSVKQIISDGIDSSTVCSDDVYRTRITEAVEKLQSVIAIMIGNEDMDANSSTIYSVLPSIYSTNMMITFKYQMKSEYLQCNDPVLKEMWDLIVKMSDGIIADIEKLK